MKRIFAILILFNIITPLSFAESIYTYSPQSSQRTILKRSARGQDMYDNLGNRRVKIREYSNGRNVLYDQDETRVFRSGNRLSANVFDNSGNKVGTVRTLSNGRAYSYDGYGNNTGTFKIFPSGRGLMYDNIGNMKGSFRTKY